MMKFFIPILLVSSCFMTNSPKENRDPNTIVSYQSHRETDPNALAKPVVMWFHNIAAKDQTPSMLNDALSGGLITHAILLFLHPDDASIIDNKEVASTIEVCKKNNVKIVWCRTLWPSYKIKKFKKEYVYDYVYYGNVIKTIREEAKYLNADYSAIDTEPYVYFPLKEKFKQTLPKEEYLRIETVVEYGVDQYGKLDFVLPCEHSKRNHPNTVFSKLGKWKIAEHTYYNLPHLARSTKRKYDIFGAYVSVQKKNPKHPHLPYYTPQEILQKQYLWGDKLGLMLYAREDIYDQVAKKVAGIKRIVPLKED